MKESGVPETRTQPTPPITPGMTCVPVYSCAHRLQSNEHPGVVFSVWPPGGAAPASVTLCRKCLLALTWYPDEITRSLDDFIFNKRWGRIEMTFQAGVPGQVYPTPVLKVNSWQHPLKAGE